MLTKAKGVVSRSQEWHSCKHIAGVSRERRKLIVFLEREVHVSQVDLVISK